MIRNIRFLTVAVCFILVFATITRAQMLGELQDFHGTDSVAASRPTWQVALDLSSIASGLLGGSTASNFHAGIQLKRRVDRNALRINAQIYPQTSNYNYFGIPDREVGTQGGNTVFLAQELNSWLGRIGCGFERGTERTLGRSYFGVDAWLLYERTSSRAWNYVEDPTDEFINRMDNMATSNRLNLNAAGPGVSPFIGFETKRWRGFSLSTEAKFDLALIGAEGYTLDDNANFTRVGYFYTFRTFPLLEFRLLYRL